MIAVVSSLSPRRLSLYLASAGDKLPRLVWFFLLFDLRPCRRSTAPSWRYAMRPVTTTLLPGTLPATLPRPLLQPHHIAPAQPIRRCRTTPGRTARPSPGVEAQGRIRQRRPDCSHCGASGRGSAHRRRAALRDHPRASARASRPLPWGLRSRPGPQVSLQAGSQEPKGWLPRLAHRYQVATDR